ncbi:AAA family ATPase [Gordonia alkanivorans]|nr:AAA family ATPase [Gordonia alkanivorans]MDH3010061.1 AAA family ATPase [Gordonia alkanivorans]
MEESLSASQLRWAQITLAIGGTYPEDRPTVVLCDEPEQGLHVSAARRLPEALTRISKRENAAFFIATHSPQTLTDPYVQAVRVDRTHRNGSRLFPNTISLVDADARRRSEHELGLNPAELQALMRVAVVVEGLHDEIVFKNLLREALDASQSGLFPLHGGRNVSALPEARLMIDTNQAPILVVMDHLRADAIGGAWERIKGHAEAGRFEDALRVVERDLKVGGGKSELSYLRQLARTSIENHNTSRLYIHGLSRPDVICYLPEEFILTQNPRKKNWHQLIDEWENNPSPTVRKRSIKEFLTGRNLFPKDPQERNISIENAAIMAAKNGMTPHQDLIGLAIRIKELADTKSP